MALVIITLMVQPVQAQQDVVWKGGRQSGEWSSKLGWEQVNVPDSSDYVLIKVSDIKGPTISTKVKVAGLSVAPGAAVYVAQGGSLTVTSPQRKNKNNQGLSHYALPFESTSKVLLFPNPAGQYFTLRVPPQSDSSVQVQLYNERGVEIDKVLHGKRVYAGGYEYTYNISHMRPGVYIVRVHTATVQQVLRLIKIR